MNHLTPSSVPRHPIGFVAKLVVVYKEDVAELCTRYFYMSMILSTRLHLQGGLGLTFDEPTSGSYNVVVTSVNGICTGFRNRLRHVLAAPIHRRSLVIIRIVFLASCKDILSGKKGSRGMGHLLCVSTWWTRDV